MPMMWIQHVSLNGECLIQVIPANVVECAEATWYALYSDAANMLEYAKWQRGAHCTMMSDMPRKVYCI
jgi:hypothetical protein